MPFDAAFATDSAQNRPGFRRPARAIPENIDHVIASPHPIQSRVDRILDREPPADLAGHLPGGDRLCAPALEPDEAGSDGGLR